MSSGRFEDSCNISTCYLSDGGSRIWCYCKNANNVWSNMYGDLGGRFVLHLDSSNANKRQASW